MCMENIDKAKFGWLNPVLVQVQRSHSHVSLQRLALTHRNLRFLLSPSRCDCPQRPSGELGPPKPSRVNSWTTAGPHVAAAQSKWRKCDYPTVEMDKLAPRFASPCNADLSLTSASKSAMLIGVDGLTQHYLWKHGQREIRRRHRCAPKKTKTNQVCGAAFAAARLKLLSCRGHVSPPPSLCVNLVHIQICNSLCGFFGA